MRPFWLLVVWLAPVWGAVPGQAESRRSLPAWRTESPPAIDGDLSEAVWTMAPHTTGFADSYLGTPATEQTEVWLCYDATHIYVAFLAHDAQPDRIVARETKEDAGLRGDDLVCFNLDPFQTRQSTDRSLFLVNPRGVHSAEIGAGRAIKTEWRGQWRSAARLGPQGWTAEMAIPWAMLSHPAGKRPVTMGLNFSRMHQRTQVASFWSYLGPRANYELDGRWEGVVPPPFRPRFSYLPYVLGQAGRASKVEAGLDVRVALTPSLTGVFTAQPDFGTVERAVEGIDFSYGERFVPDRRPFFMEGERFYTESTMVGRFFHSARVPDFDAGVNLYGKVAPKTSVGVLGAFELGGRQDYLLRGRQELRGTDSVALSVIGREDRTGDNRVFVAHPAWRQGNWICLTHWAPSFVNGRYAGDALNFDFSYNGQRVSGGNVFHYVDPGFRDDNGYIPFTDLIGNYAWLTHTTEWREGWLRRLVLAPAGRFEDRFDGRPFRRTALFHLFSETRTDYGFELHGEVGRFEQYQDRLIELRGRGRVSDRFHNYGLGVQGGRQAGADLLFLTPAVNWRFGERFGVGASAGLLFHRQDRQQAILSASYDLTRAWSLGGRLVVQTDRTSGFLSLRRSGYAGTEFYCIFGNPDPTVAFEPMVIVKIVKPF